MLNPTFEVNVHSDYGVEADDSNPFDIGNVEVPPNALDLTTQQLHELVDMYVPPCSRSNVSGLDIYIDVCSLLLSVRVHLVPGCRCG